MLHEFIFLCGCFFFPQLSWFTHKGQSEIAISTGPPFRGL